MGVPACSGQLQRHADPPELARVVGAVPESSSGLPVPSVHVVDEGTRTAGSGVAFGGAIGEGDEAPGLDVGEQGAAVGLGRGLLGGGAVPGLAESLGGLGAEAADEVHGGDVGQPVGGGLEGGGGFEGLEEV